MTTFRVLCLYSSFVHDFCYNLGDGRGIVGLLSAALQPAGPFRDGKLCVRICIASVPLTSPALDLKVHKREIF
jgi:hypothetical protein